MILLVLAAAVLCLILPAVLCCYLGGWFLVIGLAGLLIWAICALWVVQAALESSSDEYY